METISFMLNDGTIVKEILDREDREITSFIQWKGTDVCLDIYCDCGAQGHVDGYGAYAVKCRSCGAIYELPQDLVLNKVDVSEYTPLITEVD